MDDFNSETDSDYTSYWRDWVSFYRFLYLCAPRPPHRGKDVQYSEEGKMVANSGCARIVARKRTLYYDPISNSDNTFTTTHDDES